MPPDTPIYISFLALAVSVLSLGWNIYRDIILRPKLRVSFGIKRVAVNDGSRGEYTLTDENIILSGVNFGPGQITCAQVVADKWSLHRRLQGKWTRGFPVPNFEHPLCHKLPHRINMADEVKLLFLMNKQAFLSYRPTRVGIIDSFGRIHWASKRETREAVEVFLKKFPQEEQDELKRLS